MRIRIAAAVLAAVALWLPTAVSAETVTSTQEIAGTPFEAFLAGQGYRTAQASAVAQVDRAAGEPCQEGYQVRLTLLRVLRPVEMTEGDKTPTAGKWIERFEASRCGTTSLFNTIAEVKEDGRFVVTAVAPGETSQNFEMVIDLLPLLLPKADIPDCEERILRNTRLGAPEGYETAKPDGEYETWTVQGCGKKVDLVLLISTLENGSTGFSIENQVAVE